MKFAFCVALAASVLYAAVPACAGGAGSVEGLRYAKLRFDSGLSGELAVSQSNSKAMIDNAATEARFDGDSVTFSFPDRSGAFRGTLSPDRQSITGFWIQRPDPDGALGVNYASPLDLHLENGAWRGNVRPLPDTLTLYLDIVRDPDGTLKAAFRNPELNLRGGANQFLARQSGSTIDFDTPAGASRSVHISATPKNGAIAIRWPGLDRGVTLARATPDQAAAFAARPAGSPPYTYREPAELGDGWQVARAADTGMDEAKLAQFVRQIIAADPASTRPELIHSVLIAHRGKLVLEEYFHGYTAADPHDLRSAGKTFTSVILGALMHDGAAIGPGSRIVDYLPPASNPDPRKSRITLAMLMTHTSGLACDDNDDSSPGNEETMQSQHAEPNWWRYIIDLPMAHDPGTRYAYCSGGMNLVGAALTKVAHQSMPELFDRTVARKLGWSRYYWNLMPNGEGYLGGGAYVRPRDFLKLGQAYLNGGVWNGKRIVDTSWVAESTKPRVDVTPQTTGLTPEQFANVYFPGQDAYAWHLKSYTVGGRTYEAYNAGGNGGQLLIVVPAFDLAIEFTGGNYGQGGIWTKWGDERVPDEIIPAIRD